MTNPQLQATMQQTAQLNAEPEVQEAPTVQEPTVIKAVNPTKEEMEALRESIKQSYNFDVDVKPTKFTFKKRKDEDSGLEIIREPLEIAIPYPSVTGVVNIMEAGGKQLELLMEAVADKVTAQARDLINEDYKLNAANFPLEKLSWEYIANMPKAQRRGGGIPKEVWEGFAKDYITVMPAATGKNLEAVTKAAKLLQNKFADVKTNEVVIEFLLEQLGLYAEASQNAAEYAECIEFLTTKADSLLNQTPEDLLASL